jgi:hypothetical protein
MEEWCTLHGIEIVEGAALLWKAVRPDGTDWRTGKISYLGHAGAPDWDSAHKEECGAGLHLAITPMAAMSFVESKNRGKARVFQVRAALSDCRCLAGSPQYPHKIRARACEYVREIAMQNGWPKGGSAGRMET